MTKSLEAQGSRKLQLEDGSWRQDGKAYVFQPMCHNCHESERGAAACRYGATEGFGKKGGGARAARA